MAVSGSIIIGNIISFISTLFLYASVWTKDRDRTFLYQVYENVALAIANVFFGSYAGISTLLLSVARNWLVMKNRYTRRTMWIFVILVAGIGIAVNNIGLPGLLPVIATVELTICNYYLRSLFNIKLSMFINTFFWLLYCLSVKDYSSSAAEVITLILTAIAMIRISRGRTQKTMEENARL